MKKLLLFLLLPFLSFGQVQIGDDIDGESAFNDFGSSIDLSNNGHIIAIGSIRNTSSTGHVRIYENQGGNWIQIGEDINGETIGDLSGFSISISGDGSIVAIGAPLNSDSNSGHVRVYENQGGSWVQLGEDIDGDAVSMSGTSISLSDNGSVLAIGGPDIGASFSDPGYVRIYENQGDNWVQIGEDIEGEMNFDSFGYNVSLSSNGSVVAIGARFNDGNGTDSGHVRIYENQGGNWIQIGQDIDGEAAADFSGVSVSLASSGNIVAIGAPLNDGNEINSGHVRVYENQGGSWVQLGEDISGEAEEDRLGISVTLSSDGTILATGAPLVDINGEGSGQVRIYQLLGGNWIQIGDDINGEFVEDRSGTSVNLSSDGSIIAIGAPFNDGNGTDSGQVRVFDISNEILSIQQPVLTTFSLYPNPTKNNFTITLSDQDTLQKATIYNSLGQEVLNSTQNTIDVSSLSKGVYVVEVQTTTGKGSEKLIIQ